MRKVKVKNPKGAGRKPRFKPELGETTTFSCRVPKVKKQELIDYVAVKLAEWSQGSAIADGRAIMNFSPELLPVNEQKVQIMILSQIENLSLEPQPNNEPNQITSTSSPAIGNTHVVGSTGTVGDIEGINRVHHLNFMNNNLPDKCANLLICDPPYFEVKGAFDFVWKDMKAYLLDVEKWARECKRLLADNGTLFWYGDRKNIAYAQVILDEYLKFQNHIYWQKAEKCQMEMFDTLRSFYCRGYERILMYSTFWDCNTLDEIMHNDENYRTIKEYLKKEKYACMKHFGFTAKQFNEYTLKLGCSTTPYKNWFCKTGYWEMATKEQYEKLQKSGFFQKSFDDLYAEYLAYKSDYDLRRAELEEKRRPFNNFLKLSDHWKFTNDGTINELEHPTVKPEEMTRVMILTCSRPNDLVVVPFAGSGTEVAMSIKEGRRAIGFDIESKYVEMSNRRVSEILRQPTLFT